MNRKKTAARGRRDTESRNLANNPDWKRFKKRLTDVAKDLDAIHRDGPKKGAVNKAVLAKRLGLTAPRKVVAWLSGDQWPSADGLRLIAEKTGVSIDWLLGLSPLRRITDRERVGDLAREFVIHVVRAYRGSKYAHWGEGLADVLGAARVTRESANFAANAEVEDNPDGGFVVLVKDGRGLGNAYHIRDASAFLIDVTARLTAEADKFEERRDGTEAARIREECIEGLTILSQMMDEEVEEFGRPREVISAELAAGRVDPAWDGAGQTGRFWATQLRNWRLANRRRQEVVGRLSDRLSEALALQSQHDADAK